MADDLKILEAQENEILEKLANIRKQKTELANKSILDFVEKLTKEGFDSTEFVLKLCDMNKVDVIKIKNHLINTTKPVNYIEYKAKNSEGIEFDFGWFEGKSLEGRGVRKDFVAEYKKMLNKPFNVIVEKMTHAGKKWAKTPEGIEFLKQYEDYNADLIK